MTGHRVRLDSLWGAPPAATVTGAWPASALDTVYALSGADTSVAESLSPVIAQGWSLATAYALLAWFLFAPQCLSTLAVVRRETNSWRYPLIMLSYLFVLAYAAAFVTYRVTLWLGG